MQAHSHKVVLILKREIFNLGHQGHNGQSLIVLLVDSAFY